MHSSQIFGRADLERRQPLNGLAVRLTGGHARKQVDRRFGEQFDRVREDDVDDAFEETGPRLGGEIQADDIEGPGQPTVVLAKSAQDAGLSASGNEQPDKVRGPVQKVERTLVATSTPIVPRAVSMALFGGCIDYPAIRGLLTRIGYAGFITVEQERDPRNAGGSLADVKASRDYLTRIGF